MKSLLPKRIREEVEAPLSGFQREMNRMMDGFFGKSFMPEMRGAWAPSVEVSEDENDVVVKAEVAGLDAKDLDVTVTGNRLTLSGEKRDERKDTKRNYSLVERRYGRFRREIELPADVDVDNADAEFKNGVLSIRLPKTEQTRARKVTVRS